MTEPQQILIAGIVSAMIAFAILTYDAVSFFRNKKSRDKSRVTLAKKRRRDRTATENEKSSLPDAHSAGAFSPDETATGTGRTSETDRKSSGET